MEYCSCRRTPPKGFKHAVIGYDIFNNIRGEYVSILHDIAATYDSYPTALLSCSYFDEIQICAMIPMTDEELATAARRAKAAQKRRKILKAKQEAEEKEQYEKLKQKFGRG